MLRASGKIKRIYRIVLVTATVLILLVGLVLIAVENPDRFSFFTPSETTVGPTDTETPSISPNVRNPSTIHTDKQLIQHLIEMMLDDTRFEELFETIPGTQRPNVDKDTFYRYVSVLRTGIRGRITSFVAMSESEMADMRKEVYANASAYAATSESLTGYWILYETSVGDEEMFSVYLQCGDDGICSFSQEWIDGILAIHSYSSLYFDAIRNAKTEALAVLVYSDVDDDAIRIKKADALIQFYHRSILGDYSGFRLLHARADSFEYEQGSVNFSGYSNYTPQMENPPQSGQSGTPSESPSPTPTPLPVPDPSNSRQMRIVQTAPGQMRVEDPPPNGIASGDLILYRDELPLLGLGEYTYSYELNIRFGDRLSYFHMPAVAPFDSTLSIIQVIYEGINITLIGSFGEHTDAFSGNVFAVEFDSSAYQTGKGLTVGDTDDTILNQYPFADLTGWIVQTHGAYDRIGFDMRNGMSEKIVIGRMVDELFHIIGTTPRQHASHAS